MSIETALHHAYYSVGLTSKNVSRIWMQGSCLTNSNFSKGVAFEIEYNVSTRIITIEAVVEAEKTRAVSGRKNKLGIITPIIELSNKQLLKVTQGAEKVRADFYENKITISIHHLETKQEAREQSLRENLLKGYITTGVLCAGIGVSTAASHDGFLAEGIKSRTQFIVDREGKYLDVAAINNHAVNAKTKIVEGSLEEVEPELLGKINCLSFSLGCTGHSPQGKAKNKNVVAEAHKTDATALFGAMNTIQTCNPALIISENVVPAKTSESYILIRAMLEVLQYNVTEITLDSSDTGSFEDRNRYWFVATSKGLGEFNIADHFPVFNKKFSELSEILEDIPSDSPMWKSTAEKERKAALNYANGKNFGFKLGDSTVTSVGVMGKGYQKDRASEFHLKGDVAGTMRLLIPREIASAQSVPHHLIHETIDNVAFEGLGQGVDYRQAMGVSIAISRGLLQPMMNRPAQKDLLAA
jgi:DNA (cytosine-5)-methyltransferase 1